MNYLPPHLHTWVAYAALFWQLQVSRHRIRLCSALLLYHHDDGSAPPRTDLSEHPQPIQATLRHLRSYQKSSAVEGSGRWQLRRHLQQ